MFVWGTSRERKFKFKWKNVPLKIFWISSYSTDLLPLSKVKRMGVFKKFSPVPYLPYHIYLNSGRYLVVPIFFFPQHVLPHFQVPTYFFLYLIKVYCKINFAKVLTFYQSFIIIHYIFKDTTYLYMYLKIFFNTVQELFNKKKKYWSFWCQ